MRKTDVKVGESYMAKVSGKLAVVRLVDESPYGGWVAVNTQTGRKVRIKTAARLRWRIDDRCTCDRWEGESCDHPKCQGVFS